MFVAQKSQIQFKLLFLALMFQYSLLYSEGLQYEALLKKHRDYVESIRTLRYDYVYTSEGIAPNQEGVSVMVLNSANGTVVSDGDNFRVDLTFKFSEIDGSNDYIEERVIFKNNKSLTTANIRANTVHRYLLGNEGLDADHIPHIAHAISFPRLLDYGFAFGNFYNDSMMILGMPTENYIIEELDDGIVEIEAYARRDGIRTRVATVHLDSKRNYLAPYFKYHFRNKSKFIEIKTTLDSSAEYSYPIEVTAIRTSGENQKLWEKKISFMNVDLNTPIDPNIFDFDENILDLTDPLTRLIQIDQTGNAEMFFYKDGWVSILDTQAPEIRLEEPKLVDAEITNPYRYVYLFAGVGLLLVGIGYFVTIRRKCQ